MAWYNFWRSAPKIENREELRRDPGFKSYTRSLGSKGSLTILNYVAVAPPIAQAVISRVVERALSAPLRYTNKQINGPMDKLAPGFTRRSFLRALYQAILTQGNVILYRDGASLHFAVDPDYNHVTKEYEFTEFMYDSNEAEARRVSFNDAVVVRWDPAMGQSHWGSNPLNQAAPYVRAYEEAVRLLTDYSAYAFKLGPVLQTSQNIEGVTLSEDQVEYTNETLGKPGSFLPMMMEHGHTMSNPGAITNPVLEEAIVQAVTSICRIWSVPVQLMGVTPKGVRTPIEDLERHFVADAVKPLLDNVADALNHLNNVQVEFDLANLGLPGQKDRAQAVLTLSQTNCYTINEIRRKAGDKPLAEGGDEMPSPAGAPPADNDAPEAPTEDEDGS